MHRYKRSWVARKPSLRPQPPATMSARGLMNVPLISTIRMPEPRLTGSIPLPEPHPTPATPPSSNSIDSGLKQEIPHHWDCKFEIREPFSSFLELMFRGLCLVALGHHDLCETWEIAKAARDGDIELWQRLRDRLSNKIQVITVIVRHPFFYHCTPLILIRSFVP